MVKFVDGRPYPIPMPTRESRIEIGNGVETVQDGRIYVELVNWPFLTVFKGTASEYRAGIKHAIERGWIVTHS